VVVIVAVVEVVDHLLPVVTMLKLIEEEEEIEILLLTQEKTKVEKRIYIISRLRFHKMNNT